MKRSSNLNVIAGMLEIALADRPAFSEGVLNYIDHGVSFDYSPLGQVLTPAQLQVLANCLDSLTAEDRLSYFVNLSDYRLVKVVEAAVGVKSPISR